MKKSIFVLASLFAMSASAAIVDMGRVNIEKNAIELDIAYGGGCRPHSFSLKLDACAETYPLQCKAHLIENTNGDLCESFVYDTVSFALKDVGLDGSQFKGASLTVTGDNDSKATVHLP